MPCVVGPCCPSLCGPCWKGQEGEEAEGGAGVWGGALRVGRGACWPVHPAASEAPTLTSGKRTVTCDGSHLEPQISNGKSGAAVTIS